MELEEAIERLEYLMQDIEHRKMDCEAIYVVLDHLAKREKMIELMVEKYNDDFGDIGDFCQHEYCSKDYNCKECIKQYFEKKAEED